MQNVHRQKIPIENCVRAKWENSNRKEYELQLGTRKLTGENLEVVWAEFSTLSAAVLYECMTYCKVV